MYRISMNSFRTCMYCAQRSQYIRLNSKKNSFRGIYLRKYGIYLDLIEAICFLHLPIKSEFKSKLKKIGKTQLNLLFLTMFQQVTLLLGMFNVLTLKCIDSTLDVLCRQQIKLFQVVSTSEFHKY